MRRLAVLTGISVLSLVACIAVVAFAIVNWDVPIARHFWNAGRPLSPLGQAFGAAVLLSGEAAVILFLLVTRLVRGHISVFGETLAIACLASMCAYVINDHVLKVFFGVPNPAYVIHGARHGFNIWMGSDNSSFPSGHMVLAAAFAGVFMRLYRVSIWPLSGLLLVAAGLLLVGGWHFLSDIIAGAYLGTSAGILAGEVWSAGMPMSDGRSRRIITRTGSR